MSTAVAWAGKIPKVAKATIFDRYAACRASRMLANRELAFASSVRYPGFGDRNLLFRHGALLYSDASHHLGPRHHGHFARFLEQAFL